MSRSPQSTHQPSLQSYTPVWIGLRPDAHPPDTVMRHPAFDRLMARLPEPVRRTLTIEHQAALAQACRVEPTRHLVDRRLSFSVFGRGFYLVVLLGRERRALSRLARDGHDIGLRLALAYALAAGSLGLVSIGLIAALLYVIKTVVGLDLIAGPASIADAL